MGMLKYSPHTSFSPEGKWMTMLIANLSLCTFGLILLGITLVMVALKTKSISPEMKFVLYLLRSDIVWNAAKIINLVMHLYQANIDDMVFWVTDTITLSSLGISVSYAYIISICAKATLNNQQDYAAKHFKVFLLIGFAIPIGIVIM
jgi:hypothetical protein